MRSLTHPNLPISWATDCKRLALRLIKTMLNLAAASCIANSFPMPSVAPVTTVVDAIMSVSAGVVENLNVPAQEAFLSFDLYLSSWKLLVSRNTHIYNSKYALTCRATEKFAEEPLHFSSSPTVHARTQQRGPKVEANQEDRYSTWIV